MLREGHQCFPCLEEEEEGEERGGGGMASFDEDAGPPRERNEELIALLRRRGLEVEAGWLAGCMESRLKEFKKAIAHTTGIGSRDIFVQLNRP